MADAITSLLQKCNPNPAKAGKTLLVLNALGMIFAAASNTFATAIDKNTSKEDKGFLVPAGVATGVANIGLYYLMTTKIINGLKSCAVSALDGMGAGRVYQNAKLFAQKEYAKASKSLFKKPDEQLLSSMRNKLFQNGDIKGEITQAAISRYKDKTVAGMGVMGAFIGAVAGCAVLTPVIRDVSAYFVQKKMEKKNPDWSNKPYRPYFDPAHIGDAPYRRYTQRKSAHQPLSMKSYMLSTNGRTRV